jgi:hypothetical protein
VPYSTLLTRAEGQISCVDTRPSGHQLTRLEDDALIEWILSMDMRGAAPRLSTVGEMASIFSLRAGIILKLPLT